MREWLNSISETVILNGADDFQFSEDVIQALAYAYHKKFAPIEAVAFYLLVVNKMGDDDPNEKRNIEARAKELIQTTTSDEDYDADLIREHVSHYIETVTPRQRQPEPSRPRSHLNTRR